MRHVTKSEDRKGGKLQGDICCFILETLVDRYPELTERTIKMVKMDMECFRQLMILAWTCGLAHAETDACGFVACFKAIGKIVKRKEAMQ